MTQSELWVEQASDVVTRDGQTRSYDQSRRAFGTCRRAEKANWGHQTHVRIRTNYRCYCSGAFEDDAEYLSASVGTFPSVPSPTLVVGSAHQRVSRMNTLVSSQIHIGDFL